MKIRPVGAEFFPEDGRTDVTKLIVAFRNFANAPKKSSSYVCVCMYIYIYIYIYVFIYMLKRRFRVDVICVKSGLLSIK